MRSVSGRCGGWIPGGYTSGQIGDTIMEIKARCNYKFTKQDKRRKECKECLKIHSFCKLLRSNTSATGEPGKLGHCLQEG